MRQCYAGKISGKRSRLVARLAFYHITHCEGDILWAGNEATMAGSSRSSPSASLTSLTFYPLPLVIVDRPAKYFHL
jgi:hypothetical protein